MSERRILLVEDEEDQRGLMAGLLAAESYGVDQAESMETALRRLSRRPFDLVISDWKLPDRDGLQLLGEVRRLYSGTAFIMVTAYGTISHAVEAVRAGADDYLAKPFERQALLLAIERTLSKRRLEVENRRLAEALGERDRLIDLVGKAPVMQKLFRRVEKVADTAATVLITGESGTGKELAARALHSLSARACRPFVVVNCAAIPEGLLEAEFFGSEKGAYTGADRARPGRFEAADGGTLFLDEIGELPGPIQPKLLRALQGGRFTRVGGTEEKAADVRLIAATSRDLGADVASGRFREDLYYRLNVVPVQMPPLRRRREDIPRLVQHFLDRASRRHGVPVTRFPPSVMRRLVDYPWPGNVRELENAVERLVLLADDGRVREEDFSEGMAGHPPVHHGFRLPPGGLVWDEHERDCLGQALEMAGGNRARAARLLGMPYKAFLYRLGKHRAAEGGA
ncbi:MAG: sigma-54-dependent transcriptional regulator [Acidobacteriota bacterium]